MHRTAEEHNQIDGLFLAGRLLHGPGSACVWSTITNHRDVVVHGTLSVWPSSEVVGKGRFTGWTVVFHPDGSTDPFFQRSFNSWASHEHQEEAKGLLDYMESREDPTDFFLENLKNGDMDDDEYVAWLESMNIPPTTGVVICRWKDVDIPDLWLAVIKEQAVGRKLEEILEDLDRKNPGENEQLAPVDASPPPKERKEPPKPKDHQATL